MLPSLPSPLDYNIDANSILTELDKSLRSTSVGDQCEAIVRYPSLFQRYPFPILINSAALKLSEVFRNGSNFLRILILQVMKESEKHLDKILNIDEFVRHLFAVSYSNDPLARSITLRTLGNIARIVSGNKNIHHFIRNSLDSNDEIEVDAAIEASVRFAIQSKEFAENIYPKVISMIEGLTTPMKTKIKLLEVINNIHHNYSITEDARTKLISFLAKYPGKRFVCEDLHTLTSIAASSVTHIPDQVRLLLEYYINDPRSVVKFSVLVDLKMLASESAHLWEKDSISKFVDIIFANFTQNSAYFSQIILESNAKELKLLCEALGALSELLGSPSIFIDESLFPSEHLVKIISFSTQIIHQSAAQNSSNSDKVQILLVSKCFAILTNICLHSNAEFIESSDVLPETCCAYESFFYSKFTSDLNSRESKNALKVIFRCLAILCKAKESCSQQVLQITEALRFIFLKTKPTGSWFEMICETICSLASIVSTNKSLTTSDVLDLLKSRFGQSKKRFFNEHSSVILKIFVIFFQLKVGSFLTDQETQALLSILNGCNLWVCYKVVREAMRYSHHNFATQLLNRIKLSTEPIENTYFWINSLTKIAQAESYLGHSDLQVLKESDFSSSPIEEHKFEEKLSMTVSTYTEGFTHLKASVSNSNLMRFQCEFIKLRMKYLQAHQHFRQCCKLLQSSPPPISAMVGLNLATLGNSSTDDFLKCGRIVTSMRKCATEFRSIAKSYSFLYQSSFNADPNSLYTIIQLQHCCTILAEVIENLFQGSHRINSLFVPSASTAFEDSGATGHKLYSTIEHRELEDVCTLISEMVQNDQLLSLCSIELKQGASSNHFLTVFTKQVQMLLRISTRILAVSLPFPRFYFQSIQATSIKLELSPQPRNNLDFIMVNLSAHFVLNVEGVVVHGSDVSAQQQTGSQKAVASLTSSAAFLMPGPASMATSSFSGNLKSESKEIRKVSKVLLTLNATQNDALGVPPVLSMHSIVVPLNDYFQSQFLLTFKNTGFYQVTVETSIIDENEAQWKTGPIQSIMAKVIDDFK